MDRIHFTHITDLQIWLAAKDIHTTAWKTEGKQIEHLWAEFQNGEFSFQNDPPLRLIQVVQLIIRQADRILFEAEQELGNGQRRFRNQPPSEKMKLDENYLAAALRCCQEELGVSGREVRLFPETHYQWEKTAESLSYPGLMTRYTFHSLEAQVKSLPRTDFWRNNRAHIQGDPVKRHRWEWRQVSSDSNRIPVLKK